MAKVDWITWKTNKEDIINPEKEINSITNITNDYFNKFDTIIKNELDIEKKKGGLSTEAMSINNDSPVYEKTLIIEDKINELLVFINKFNSILEKNIMNQKEIEKKQLIQSINDKMEEEEKKLNSSYKLKEKINNKNTLIQVNDVDNIINITNDRIKKLKDKLSDAERI